MTRYCKKPVEIEAIQWTGSNVSEIQEFVGESAKFEYHDEAWKVGAFPCVADLTIHTLEGDHHASIGDFIIKGIKGEFYPCKPDIFAQTYDPVEASLSLYGKILKELNASNLRPWDSLSSATQAILVFIEERQKVLQEHINQEKIK